MAWQRVDDKELAWDLMQAGLLYVKGNKDNYTHYEPFAQEAWAKNSNIEEWFGSDNTRENYIHVEE